MSSNIGIVEASEEIVLANCFDGGARWHFEVSLRWGRDLQGEDLG